MWDDCNGDRTNEFEELRASLQTIEQRLREAEQADQKLREVQSERDVAQDLVVRALQTDVLGHELAKAILEVWAANQGRAPRETKIEIIKAIRRSFGIGLRESKTLLDLLLPNSL